MVRTPSTLQQPQQPALTSGVLPCNGTGPFFSPKAEVCNQKAEVDEGAGEGAELSRMDFFNDLECFC
jgi:hypothetical protein